MAPDILSRRRGGGAVTVERTSRSFMVPWAITKYKFDLGGAVSGRGKGDQGQNSNIVALVHVSRNGAELVAEKDHAADDGM